MNPEFVNPVRRSPEVDISNVPPQKLVDARNRVAVLSTYRFLFHSGNGLSANVAKLIATAKKAYPGMRLSEGTLRRWHRECPPISHEKAAVAYFIDKRGGDSRKKCAASETGAQNTGS